MYVIARSMHSSRGILVNKLSTSKETINWEVGAIVVLVKPFDMYRWRSRSHRRLLIKLPYLSMIKSQHHNCNDIRVNLKCSKALNRTDMKKISAGHMVLHHWKSRYRSKTYNFATRETVTRRSFLPKKTYDYGAFCNVPAFVLNVFLSKIYVAGKKNVCSLAIQTRICL